MEMARRDPQIFLQSRTPETIRAARELLTMPTNARRDLVASHRETFRDDPYDHYRRVAAVELAAMRLNKARRDRDYNAYLSRVENGAAPDSAFVSPDPLYEQYLKVTGERRHPYEDRFTRPA